VTVRKQAKGLIDQIVLQLQHDANQCVPVVELDCSHYHHKDYGKTYFPVLDPIRWINIDGEGEQAEATQEAPKPEKKAAAKPKRRGRAKAAEPEATDEPPFEPDTAETDAVVAEMEGTEAEPQPPKSRRRRRAV